METKQKSIRENFKEVFLSFQITGKTNMEQGPWKFGLEKEEY